MDNSKRNRHRRHRRQRQGLILLLALGMLALFSLLAVTWVVSASSSRTGAQAMRVRASHSSASVKGMTSEVMKMAVRGTKDQKSAFYKHALLEDVYDANAIRVQFGHRFFGAGINTFQDKWCRKLTPSDRPGVELIKVSLDPRNRNNLAGGYASYQLSPIEGAYNGRVLTVLEGPLSGYSFRIYKYVGYVRSANDSVADPNLDGSMPGAPQGNYPQNTSIDYDYSVMIDVSSIKGKLEGKWRNPNTSRVETFSGELGDWLSLPNSQGLRNLFFFYEPATQAYQGYKCMINGNAFNNAAIGLETNPGQPGYGNIDARNLMRIPTTKPKIPPALLPNYDYLQNPDLMATNGGIVGVSGVGDQSLLKGQSNEGYDVADWRDYWLSFTDGSRILPSFYRPELIHYISHVFGPPADAAEASELLRLIDASSARVMNYSYRTGNNNIISVNPYFQPNSSFPSYPRENLAQNVPLSSYINQLISGPWDVDNDGDGTPDSVWINPNLPAIHAPDGRLLKALTAVMIQDLDGRLNINLHGDRVQGSAAANFNGSGTGFNAFGYSQGLHRFGMSLSQGFGYGPADISLNPLFENNASLLTSSSGYSIFDLRYGARPYASLAFNTAVDRSPGRPLNDPQSALMEREFPLNGIYGHGTMPGAPMGRRSSVAPTFDKHGNLVYLYPQVPDATPESGVQQGFPSETIGDAYESGSGKRDYGDTPFTLSDLESILRRYDEDVSSLPSELRARFAASGFGSGSDVNRLITTHSAELRYPKLTAVAPTLNGTTLANSNGYNTQSDPGNLLGLIRMLHEQRYRKRTLPVPNLASDEYALSVESLSELFPPEFSMNLRLNLNRPFGDGEDGSGNGQFDEPAEIFYFSNNEVERKWDYANGQKIPSGVAGLYTRGLNLRNSTSRQFLGSRQLLARYLYCLAQLVIPRDYEFPSMETVTNQLQRDKFRARALAQWAVNVVDFRDTDAAMTRFEYDIYPFGVRSGNLDRPAFWAPDRLINSGNNPVDSSMRQYIGVVWGMEQPELLLTESLAFHDKRLRDTDLDGGSAKEVSQGDNDFDQYRFPQGSLFLEVYAPRSTYLSSDPVLPGAPSSLYGVDSNNGNRVKLVVNKMAPTSQAWGAQPVWRIGISDSTLPGTANRNKNPNVLYQANDNNTNRLAWLDPQFAQDSDISGDQNNGNPEYNVGSGLNQLLTDATPNTEVFERMIWFTQQSARNVPRVPNLVGNDVPAQNANREFMVYYNRSTQQGNPLYLEGGSYMVVGPRPETNVGSLVNNPTDGTQWNPILKKSQLTVPETRPIHSPSHQSITLRNNVVSTSLLNGESITRYRPDWVNQIKAPVGLVCAAEAPTSPPGGGAITWQDCFPKGVGINISMPNPIANQGYWQQNLMPTTVLNSQDRQQGRSDNRFGYNDLPPDSWVDVSNTAASTFPDQPFDYRPNVNPVLNPNGAPPMTRTGTYDNVRTACLQRLADPELPYDPVNNPYITVDWISLDLTVFNGEAPRGSDPSDPAANVAFQSRYKDGGTRRNANTKSSVATGQPNGVAGGQKNWGFSYHSASTAQVRTTPYQNSFVNPDPPAGNGQQFERYPSYFNAQLGYASQQPGDNNMTQSVHSSATTLGYVNVGYRHQNINGNINDTADQYDGFGPPQLVQNQPDYNGSPRDLTSPVWMNRTFANAHELMMIPLTSSGQFGYYFDIADDNAARTPFGFLPSFQVSNALVTNLENAGSNDFMDYAPTDANASNVAKLNGYWMRRSGDWQTTSGKPRLQADWGLILELVETQTPYVDTIKQLDVERLQAAAFPSGNIDPWAARFLASFIPENFTNNGERESFRGASVLAPYHQLPTYVSPGKINLNTISSEKVFQGLEYLFTNTTERQNLQNGLFNQFVLNRKGFNGGNSSSIGINITGMDPNYPTLFAGAYRSGLATNLYPFAPNQDSTNRPQTTQRGRYASESTVLRSLDRNPTGKEQPNGQNQGNLLYSPYSVANAEAGNIGGVNPLEYAEARQNAFTRYQRAMRLSNLTTDQSNVFAMWVTVALFEYDPVTGFGKEYTNTAGEPERERAFYIIDRTVPVGFLPGEDLNTDQTVLLKRTINNKRR